MRIQSRFINLFHLLMNTESYQLLFIYHILFNLLYKKYDDDYSRLVLFVTKIDILLYNRLLNFTCHL